MSVLTLGDKRRLFTQFVGKLITFAYSRGYELSLEECKRSDEQAEINALGTGGRDLLVRTLLTSKTPQFFGLLAEKISNNTGSGIRGTLHELGLAIDINLFKNRVYFADSSSYKFLGDYWKSLHSDCCWGGDFEAPDGNHFSFTHEGKK